MQPSDSSDVLSACQWHILPDSAGAVCAAYADVLLADTKRRVQSHLGLQSRTGLQSWRSAWRCRRRKRRRRSDLAEMPARCKNCIRLQAPHPCSVRIESAQVTTSREIAYEAATKNSLPCVARASHHTWTSAMAAASLKSASQAVPHSLCTWPVRSLKEGTFP